MAQETAMMKRPREIPLYWKWPWSIRISPGYRAEIIHPIETVERNNMGEDRVSGSKEVESLKRLNL